MFGRCKHVWSRWKYFYCNVKNYDGWSGEYLFTHRQGFRSRECYKCGIVKEKKC